MGNTKWGNWVDSVMKKMLNLGYILPNLTAKMNDPLSLMSTLRNEIAKLSVFVPKGGKSRRVGRNNGENKMIFGGFVEICEQKY